MDQRDSQRRAISYCRKNSIDVDFGNLLGTGQEGFVWKSNRDTALKIFDRKSNFDRELACYLILSDFELSEIDGFSVPQLVGHEPETRVIELSTVSPPYILDFGKAYVHRAPEFDEIVMADDERMREELFGSNWPVVQGAIYSLEAYGIFYRDARPANIDCTGHPECGEA